MMKVLSFNDNFYLLYGDRVLSSIMGCENPLKIYVFRDRVDTIAMTPLEFESVWKSPETTAYQNAFLDVVEKFLGPLGGGYK